MREKLEVLIKRLLFLTAAQRSRLLVALPRLKEADLEAMYSSFLRLHAKEDTFVGTFLGRHPEFLAQIEASISSLEVAAQVQAPVSQATDKLAGLENLLKKLT